MLSVTQVVVDQIADLVQYGCNFYNIFHPMDGIAYRLEPFLIPGYEKVLMTNQQC